ncbi:MAG: tetratricopeptide repeat protein, partial [Chloroflexia bacterium]
DGADSFDLTLFPAADGAVKLMTRKAEACVRDGRFRDAVVILERVVKYQPSDPGHRVSLASAYQELLTSGAVSDLEEEAAFVEQACEHLLHAVRLDPDFAPAYRSLGYLYNRMEAPWRAREMWSSYLDIEPHGQYAVEIANALDELNRLQHLHRLCEDASYMINHEEADRGLDLLREVTQQEPDWYEAWFWTGLAFRELDLFDEGVEAFARAAELDPSSSFAFNELASLLAYKGEREAAEGFWRKALELDDEEPRLMASLAQLLWQEERRSAAAELYRRALDIDPANRKLSLQLRSLQSGGPPPAWTE